ncbi:MAG: hypothetical protein OXC81_04045 [Betaproteobacteria bacterium]|nr:hypothetical protein [Betaproteobacteria bacterium]
MVLVATYFVVKVFLANSWFMEDTFIYMRIAENFAAGYGLVYNPGEYYYNSSDFLWNLLLSTPYFLSIDPALFVKLANGFFGCAAAVLVYLIVGRLTDRFSALLAMILIATHWTFFVLGQVGYMIYLTCIAALATVYFAIRYAENPGGKSALAAGLSLFMLPLTRLDAMLPFSVLWCLMAWLTCRHGNSRKVHHLLVACALPVLLFAGVLLGKYLYYGDILPVGYHVKIGAKVPKDFWFYFKDGLLYNWTYLRQYGFFVFIPVAIFLAAQEYRKRKGLSHKKRKKLYPPQVDIVKFPVLIACIAVVFLQFAYMLRTGGIVEEFRFHKVTAPFLFILIMQSMWRKRNIAVVSTVIMIGASIVHATTYKYARDGLAFAIKTTNPLEETVSGSWQSMSNQRFAEFAEFFSELPDFHPDIKIASGTGGTPAFYLRQHFVEMHGYLDTSILEDGNHYKNPGHSQHGHYLWVNPTFLLQKRVNLVFGVPHFRPKNWRKLVGGQNLADMFFQVNGAHIIPAMPSDMQIVEFPMSDGTVLQPDT